MGKIIWLASYPKSGNTWLRAFLYNLLREPGDAPDMHGIINITTSDSLIEWYRRQDPRPPSHWSPEDIAAMRRGAQQAICAMGKRDVFVKTHNAFIVVNNHPMIHMDLTAGAIYVVRNPLDICISLAHHQRCPIDEAIRIMADPKQGGANDDAHVYEVRGSWSLHVESWTHRPWAGLQVIRYEDLCADPANTFLRLMNFLGLGPLRSRLDDAVASSAFNSLRELEDKQGFAEKPAKADRFFREGRAGQWRDILTRDQIDRITAAHQTQMERFGYWPPL